MQLTFIRCLLVFLGLALAEVKSKHIYKIDDENDENVLNIFMIGDWGGPHGELPGPPQDRYRISEIETESFLKQISNSLIWLHNLGFCTIII